MIMSIEKLNIQEKADNPNKKALLDRLGVPQDESLSAQETNKLVGKTNELVDKTNELNQKFDAYKPVNAFNFKENVATYANLPTTGLTKDDAYGVIADGLVYIYNGTAFPTLGNGLNLGLKPTPDSKVAAGNELAVSGGETYNAIKLNENKIQGNWFKNTGKFINNSGVINTTPNSSAVTDFIPLDNVSNITVKGRATDLVLLYAFFDDKKTFISGVGGASNNNKEISITRANFPANAKYIVVTGNNNGNDILLIKNIMDLDYDINIINRKINEIIIYDKIINVLSGGRIAEYVQVDVIGDVTVKVESATAEIVNYGIYAKKSDGTTMYSIIADLNKEYIFEIESGITQLYLFNTNYLSEPTSFTIKIVKEDLGKQIERKVALNSDSLTENLTEKGKFGFYNLQDTDEAIPLNTSETLVTTLFDVLLGDRIESNTQLSPSSVVGHTLFNNKMKIVKTLTLVQAKNYTITQADINLGVVKVAIAYRTTAQTEPFYILKHSSLKLRVFKNSDDIIELKNRLPKNEKTYLLFGDSQLGQAQDTDIRIQSVIGGNVFNFGFGGCMMSYRSENGTNQWDAFSMVNIADCLVSKDFSSMENQTNLITQYPYFGTNIQDMKNLNLGDGNNIVLTIAYSGNDFATNIQLGNENSFIKTEFKGAINYAVSKLFTAFPRMTIVLVGTPYRVYEYTEKTTAGITLDSDEKTNTLGLKRYDYNDAMLDQAKVLKIPAFDVYRRSGRNKYNVWTLCPSDGTHPTAVAGRQAQADFYVKLLTSF